MPYVRRDADGKIVALLLDAADDAREQLGSSDPQIIAFLGEGGNPAAFSALDLDFVRVTEDLIYTLIEKECCSSPTCPMTRNASCANARASATAASPARWT